MKKRKQIVAALMAVTLVCQSNVIANAMTPEEMRLNIESQESDLEYISSEIDSLTQELNEKKEALSFFNLIASTQKEEDVELPLITLFGDDKQTEMFANDVILSNKVLVMADFTKNASDNKNTFNSEVEELENKINAKVAEKDLLISSISMNYSILEQMEKENTFEGVELQYSSAYNVSESKITPKGGVCHYNGHKETYYSEKVLPGGGLKIPGRHVADDGTIRDEDGYICVASDLSFMERGSTLMTSLGPAKVYDTGCDYGTIDIYVNW